MIIAIMLSSLALLAATAGLILTIRERKRSLKRNTALVRYAEQLISDATNALRKEYDSRVGNLEKGIVPDFEKAKEAANAVNDFNAGISAIMGFDPFETMRQKRDGGGGGDKG